MTALPASPLRHGLARALGLGVALLPVGIVTGLPGRFGLFILEEQVAVVILALGLALVFLRVPGGLGRHDRLVSDLLAGVSLAYGAVLAVRFPDLSGNAFFRPVEAAAFGVVAFLLLVESLRRTTGSILTVVLLVLAAYALFGHLLPASLAGKSLGFLQLLGFLGTDSTALLGQTLSTACFVIVPFILFGRLLTAVGAAAVFDALGSKVAGRAPGASGRVTIVSSMLFGMISGSAVANVMANGTVTIGMMTRNGYSKEDAAAAEAVSSTGGQIMPPVMGAAAFIMAEYLRVPYATIMLAAIVPALLFYGATALQLDFTARRDGLPPFAEEAPRPLASLKLESVLLALAFLVLLGGIFWSNLTTELAAIAASGVLAMAALLLVRRQGFTVRRLVAEAAETGLASAEVLLVCALAGMIIGVLGTTGLGFTLSLILLEIGKTSLFLLLVVTAAVSLILGMGMPTTAVYMLLATLAAPTLVQLGVPALAAHMFVFYFGLLSMITPPVALAAFAAATLAGASPVTVALHCVRMAWIAFLVPFLFVYQPAVLLIGGPAEIAAVAAGCLVAVPLVCGGLVGHALAPVTGLRRVAWIGLGLLILVPVGGLGSTALAVELVALAAGAAVLALHWSAATGRRLPFATGGRTAA